MHKDSSSVFIAYVIFHIIITALLGYFIFDLDRAIEYLPIFIAIEIVWTIHILIDNQEKISINAHYLEELDEAISAKDKK